MDGTQVYSFGELHAEKPDMGGAGLPPLGVKAGQEAAGRPASWCVRARVGPARGPALRDPGAPHPRRIWSLSLRGVRGSSRGAEEPRRIRSLSRSGASRSLRELRRVISLRGRLKVAVRALDLVQPLSFRGVEASHHGMEGSFRGIAEPYLGIVGPFRVLADLFREMERLHRGTEQRLCVIVVPFHGAEGLFRGMVGSLRGVEGPAGPPLVRSPAPSTAGLPLFGVSGSPRGVDGRDHPASVSVKA